MKTDKILFSENKKLSSWHDLIHLPVTYDKVLINIKKKNQKTKNVAICANITLIYCFKTLL